MFLGSQLCTLNMGVPLGEHKMVTDHSVFQPISTTHKTKGFNLQKGESNKPFTLTPSTHNSELSTLNHI